MRRSSIVTLCTLGLLTGAIACDKLTTSPTPVENRSTSEGVRQTGSKTIRLEAIAEVSLTPADVANIPADVIAAARASGWEQNASGFERLVAVPGAAVTINGQVFESDSEGRLSLPINVQLNDAGTMEIGGIVSRVLVQESQGVQVLRADKRFLRGAHNHDHHASTQGSVDPRTASQGDNDRCLDYNGRFTDRRNWSVKENASRWFINFIGSDCDMANARVLHCWVEPFNPGCAKRHGGSICSVFIKHSQSLHWH